MADRIRAKVETVGLNNVPIPDVLQAASLFKANPALTLTFRTISRIHPRMKAALDILVEEGVLNRVTLPEGGWSFTVADRAKLKETPVISMREAKRNPLPLTV